MSSVKRGRGYFLLFAQLFHYIKRVFAILKPIIPQNLSFFLHVVFYCLSQIKADRLCSGPLHICIKKQTNNVKRHSSDTSQSIRKAQKYGKLIHLSKPDKPVRTVILLRRSSAVHQVIPCCILHSQRCGINLTGSTLYRKILVQLLLKDNQILAEGIKLFSGSRA